MATTRDDLKMLDKVKYNKYLVPSWKFTKYKSINGRIFKGNMKNRLFNDVNKMLGQKGREVMLDFYFENGDNSYRRLSAMLKPIQMLAYDLVTSTGLRIINKGRMFISSYKVNEKSSQRDPGMKYHADDSLGEGNVETCIFYIKKSDKIKGGNLCYINSNGEKKLIRIKENDLLIFSGDIEHKPNLVTGVGERNAVILQFHSMR